MRNRPKSDAQKHTDKTVGLAVAAVVGATTGGGRIGGVGAAGIAMSGTQEGIDDDGNYYTKYPMFTELDSTNTDGPVTS